MKNWLLIALLAVLLPASVAAQDLTETYHPPSGSVFVFDYPAGWTVDDRGGTLVLTSPDGLIVGVVNPEVVSRVGANLTPAETLDLLLSFTLLPASDVTTVMIGSRELARATFTQGGGQETIAAAVRFSPSDTGVVVGVTSADRLAALEPVVLAIAASLRLSDATPEAPSQATEAAAEPLPESVLFADDFERGLTDNWVVERGTVDVVDDGGSRVLRLEDDAVAYVAGSADWTDYDFEARVKVTQPATIDGLLGVRYEPGTVRLYGAYFSTQNDTMGMAYFLNITDFKQLSSSRVTLAPGQWYTFRLVVDGTLTELYVNGHRTNWLESVQFVRGAPLIYVSAGAQFYVDDVVIRDLRGG